MDGSEDDEVGEDYVRPPTLMKKKYHKFNLDVDMKDPNFRVGMTFSNCNVFREAIQAHTIKHRRAVKFDKNNKDKIKASCKSEECKWMVYASWLNTDHKTFKVKTLYDEHTCAMTFQNKALSTSFLTKKYLNQWRANPKWTFVGFEQ